MDCGRIDDKEQVANVEFIIFKYDFILTNKCSIFIYIKKKKNPSFVTNIQTV